jgi:hypothetical protein
MGSGVGSVAVLHGGRGIEAAAAWRDNGVSPMNHRLILAVVLAGCSLQIAIPFLFANDTAATLGAGGLIPVKSSTVVMDSEDLRISPHLINVKYVFRNGTNRDVDLTVAFPLPEIDGGAAANIPINIPSTDTNFVDFHATVDGRPIQAMTEVRAFFYGSEITYELRSLGLPFSVLDKNVTAKFNGLPVENRQELERRGWIDCSLSRDGRCWPLWQTRVQFYWTEHFKAHSKVEVLHTYRPVVGGSYITMNDTGESNIAPYCGGVAAIDQIKRLKAQHPPKGPSETAVMEKTISYILTTANNVSVRQGPS